MNYLEKLLQGAPVEWKTLGEVLDYEQPTPFLVKSKEYSDEHETPVLTAGQSFILGYTNETDGIYQASKENPVIIFDDFTTSFHWVDFPFKVKSSAMKMLSPKGDTIHFKYVFYAMKCIHYKPEDHARQWISKYSKIKIPIPPLSVQREIARILDAFTAITSELTSELTLRQKQYQHYRDKLLTFGDEVEWRTLGEICEKIYSGGTPKTNIPEYWENGSIPWMSSGEVNLETIYQTEKFITQLGLDNSSAKFVPKNSIVIALAGQGKTRGKVARTRIDLTTNQSLASLTFNEEKINHDFVYHFLLTQYENLRQISSGSGTRGGLNLQMISNYKIPVPSLEEQKRIAAILDKFHTLTSSLSDGLPKEIELRQKQYEYYRDLLLNFKQDEARFCMA
ncbi:restriction endonuclease subunit S [Avibacterium sp. 21-594]|uniref:restriction endonuclease subunit S n=1 Tax=Avibacterium sp. 21-594 TaxID=2911535 RepID=UPI002246B769|nr:restriction endonuclease subunit S [Avibacterium sp. 21-594]MCW9716122.1 restriction endonuclease subunit S [Avibacterium sp. 21-594]